MSSAGRNTSRRSTLSYATLGATGVLLGASGVGLMRSCAPSADVIAESRPGPIVDFSELKPGESLTIKVEDWPLYVRVLSHMDLELINSLPTGPYAKTRVLQGRNLVSQTAGFVDALPENIIRGNQNPFVALWRICTKFGCVPLENTGEYDGFFCPCSSTHFDLLGRFQKGAEPENMYLPAVKMYGATQFAVLRGTSVFEDYILQGKGL
ncbi:MAG: hypothetical protein AAF408_06160 [Pseudomonadota bacterium]